ncbi:MAG: transcriptional regulator [Deferribacteres bacterium]|nr:transcriptional regulator [Deferribacteres bacterium]
MSQKKKTAQPPAPAGRHETVRQEIISAITDRPLSIKYISAAVKISEKEICAHLRHIGRTVTNRGQRLVITPAECRKCRFVFQKRKKLKRPGRCPVCRAETIKEPLFEIR